MGARPRPPGNPVASVHLVTAAQAAHWFDPLPTVQEFQRILTPGGSVLLVWNDWRSSLQSGFTAAYGEMVSRFGEQMPEQVSRRAGAELRLYFPGGHEVLIFPNPLTLDRERLQALAESVSYLPQPGTPAHTLMTQTLDRVFETHQQAGAVVLDYVTYAYIGQLERPS